MTTPFVSILMLTHNASDYVLKSIQSVRKMTDNVRYELVVLDNNSMQETRDLVSWLRAENQIETLVLLDRNSLFAEGNNIASTYAHPDATHLLLLNSDIEVKNEAWLSFLLDNHIRGITSFGIAHDPDRVDGYCLLIDADLYRQYPLDEGHQWWWAVAKMQAQVLKAGYAVRGFQRHERFLHHFGGKSGSGFKNARGMDVSKAEVMGWFAGLRPNVVDKEKFHRKLLRVSLSGNLPKVIWKRVSLFRAKWVRARRTGSGRAI